MFIEHDVSLKKQRNIWRNDIRTFYVNKAWCIFERSFTQGETMVWYWWIRDRLLSFVMLNLNQVTGTVMIALYFLKVSFICDLRTFYVYRELCILENPEKNIMGMIWEHLMLIEHDASLKRVLHKGGNCMILIN